MLLLLLLLRGVVAAGVLPLPLVRRSIVSPVPQVVAVLVSVVVAAQSAEFSCGSLPLCSLSAVLFAVASLVHEAAVSIRDDAVSTARE